MIDNDRAGGHGDLMRHIKMWVILFVGLVPTALIAQPRPVSRDVVLEVRCPNGATPQLRISEGGTGSVNIPRVGHFGFSPTLGEHDDNVVVVELFDLSQSPRRSMGRVEVTAGGEEVQSGTSPQFGMKVLKVTER
jgi:hypothetical protein